MSRPWLRFAAAALTVLALGCDGQSSSGAEPGISGLDAQPDVAGDEGVAAEADAHPKSDSAPVCPPGRGDCDGALGIGCETDLLSDPDNCGACGISCDAPYATTECSGGSCAIVECDEWRGDCDGDPSNGCEVDLTSDPQNCAGCGMNCVFPGGSGACCDGICSGMCCGSNSINCSPNSCPCDCHYMIPGEIPCGPCGSFCFWDPNHGHASCIDDKCVVTSCDQGFADCDGVWDNGCEVDTTSDPESCGGCGVSCGSGQACQDGVCQ